MLTLLETFPMLCPRYLKPKTDDSLQCSEVYGFLKQGGIWDSEWTLEVTAPTPINKNVRSPGKRADVCSGLCKALPMSCTLLLVTRLRASASGLNLSPKRPEAAVSSEIRAPGH